jgi:hypothetical protein
MINIELDTFKSNMLKHKKEDTAYFIKSLYSDIPSWESLLECLSQISMTDGTALEEARAKNNGESRIGNILYKGLYFNLEYETEKLENYFPTIHKILKEINDYTSFKFKLSGLKISLFPYYVVPHTDVWDGFALQAQGVSNWKIKSEDGLYQEEFSLEAGDFLFFPKGCTHEIDSTNPRSTFIFISRDIK